MLITGLASGQQAEFTELSFKEAVQIALDNDVSIQQQRNQLVANQVQKVSDLTSMTPRVSINGNAGRNEGNSFNQQEGRVVNGVLDFVNGSVDASMTLFNGFNRLNTYKQSRSLLDSQSELVRRTNQDVMQTVSTQFLQCLLDRELLKIDITNLETQKKQLDQITQQVLAGSVAEVDKFNQEYQVKNAELLVLRSRNTLANDKAILAQSLQVYDVEFELIDPDWTVNDVDFDNIDLNDLYEEALQNRSDLKQSRYQEEASKFGYKATKGTYFPSVNAFFSYGSAYNAIEGFDNRTFEQQFTSDNTQTTYGVSFSIPIFNGLRSRSQVVQSRVTHQNAILDAKAAEITVRSDVLRSYQNLKDAVTNFQAAQAQLEAALISYDLEKERYNLGISDLVEFSQANQAYVRAQTDLARARYTLLFQDLLLQYATGTLKFEDLP